jgi:hypothetical protein
MENFKNQLVRFNSNEYTNEELVEYFQLIGEKLGFVSVKELAEKLGKSQQGIRGSNNYMKIKFGSVILVTDKLKENKFPF